MAVPKKYAKLVCNGILFVILFLVVALCLMNLVSPRYPPLSCEATVGVKDPSISHPFTGDTISTLKLLFVIFVPPFIQMFVTEWFYLAGDLPSYTTIDLASNQSSRWKRTLLQVSRWFRDYIFGLVTVLLLNDIAKTTLNAPRPHWLDSCKPTFSKDACQLGWIYDYECTNKNISNWKLIDARKSFPSGHAALGFYTAFFMGIYQHSRVNKRMLGTVFLLWLHILWFGFAIFCCISRVADKRHHPIDIAFGGILGTIGGLCTAVFLCNCFIRTGSQKHLISYHHNPSKANGITTDRNNGSNSSSTTSAGSMMNGSVPGSGARGIGILDKRPSLRRLLSTQSNMTTMSDITEDRELDNL